MIIQKLSELEELITIDSENRGYSISYDYFINFLRLIDFSITSFLR
jgi:hypothetical protein